MARFGKKSQDVINTLHPDLQKICNEVIKHIDYSSLEGARPDETQYKYFKEGKSKLDGITKKSKHQVTIKEPLSKAVDVAPYPIDFKNKDKAKARFYFLAGYFFQASEMLYEAGEITHKLRWGGDWDSDKEFQDQSFDDLPHFELLKVTNEKK